MDYIDRIKQLRIQSNLTQVQLSKALGLSESAYGLYETRKRQMDIETFVKICREFHVTSDELLGL